MHMQKEMHMQKNKNAYANVILCLHKQSVWTKMKFAYNKYFQGFGSHDDKNMLVLVALANLTRFWSMH